MSDENKRDDAQSELVLEIDKLLNRLQPGLGLRTREVSERIRRGRNTTVAAAIVPIDGGGWLVDTPGFSEVGLWGIEPRELASCFPEMREPLERCKFPDCTHRTEPGCAVTEAVAAGRIAGERYRSYQVLLEELRSAPEARSGPAEMTSTSPPLASFSRSASSTANSS